MMTLSRDTAYGDQRGVHLRAFTPAHISEVLKIIEASPWGLEDFLKRQAANYLQGLFSTADAALFAAYFGGEFIGAALINQIVPYHRAWYHGWGTAQYPTRPLKAARLALDYAFHEWHLMQVATAHAENNHAATWVCQKLGFRKEGVQRGHFQFNGRQYDGLLMGMTREEWVRG